MNYISKMADIRPRAQPGTTPPTLPWGPLTPHADLFATDSVFVNATTFCVPLHVCKQVVLVGDEHW